MLYEQVLHAFGPKGGIDSRPQLKGIERLGNEVHGTKIESRDLVLRTAGTRQEDDRDHGELAVRLERQTHIEPGHVRHVDVQEDEVRPLAPGHFETGLAAVRIDKVQALFAQPCLGQGQCIGAVVHYQHLHGH